MIYRSADRRQLPKIVLGTVCFLAGGGLLLSEWLEAGDLPVRGWLAIGGVLAGFLVLAVWVLAVYRASLTLYPERLVYRGLWGGISILRQDIRGLANIDADDVAMTFILVPQPGKGEPVAMAVFGPRDAAFATWFKDIEVLSAP